MGYFVAFGHVVYFSNILVVNESMSYILVFVCLKLSLGCTHVNSDEWVVIANFIELLCSLPALFYQVSTFSAYANERA